MPYVYDSDSPPYLCATGISRSITMTLSCDSTHPNTQEIPKDAVNISIVEALGSMQRRWTRGLRHKHGGDCLTDRRIVVVQVIAKENPMQKDEQNGMNE